MMRTRLGFFIAFILSLQFVAACGQQGPLYLPGSPSQIEEEVSRQQAAPVAEPEEEDEEEDEDEEPTDNIN